MQIQKPKHGYKLVKSLFGKYEEIPEDWKLKTFGELFKFLRTATNPRDDLGKNGDVQYIHYGDIHAKWHSILDCDLEEIPWIDETKVHGLPFLKEGDLIIADASEDYEGSGASVLLKNVKNRKIVSGLHTIALQNIDENVSLDFKKYLTSIKFVKKQIVAYVTGISVYGLSKNNLKKIRIPLPPLTEQQKIALVVTNVDSLIRQTQKEIEQTQRLKKGLVHRLLTKGIGNTKFKKTDFSYNPYQLLTIPDNWNYVKLGETGDFINGLNKEKEDYGHGCLHVNIDNIFENFEINLDKLGRVSATEKEIERYRLEKNDILLLRSSVKLDGVGYPALFGGSKEPVVFSGFIIRFRPDEKIWNPRFLTHLLRTVFIRWNVKAWATVSANVNINQESYKMIPLPQPPLKEQEQITSILTNLDSKIEWLMKSKSNMEKIKKGLMQKLLTGQIRVKA